LNGLARHTFYISILHIPLFSWIILREYQWTVSVDCAKHLSKFIRQKHTQREQERNLLPHILIVDIDFSQNFIYTDRKSAIQSDHWTSTSVTLFAVKHGRIPP
jgi:hypothetical protein